MSGQRALRLASPSVAQRRPVTAAAHGAPSPLDRPTPSHSHALLLSFGAVLLLLLLFVVVLLPLLLSSLLLSSLPLFATKKSTAAAGSAGVVVVFHQSIHPFINPSTHPSIHPSHWIVVCCGSDEAVKLSTAAFQIRHLPQNAP